MFRSIRHAVGVLAVLSCAVLTGCASFPSDKLGNAAVPDTAGRAYEPSAYIEVKFFQGKPGDARAVEIPAGKQIAQAAVERVLLATSPFSRYTFDAFEQEKMDHVVRLHYYNHGEAGAGVLLGLLCGFSFGVIPAVATDNYTVLASVIDKGEGPVKRSDDSITTWMGLWFLPLAGNTPQKASEQTFEELTRDALRQLIAGNQLRFTAPAPVATQDTAPAAAASAATTPPAEATAPAPSPQR